MFGFGKAALISQLKAENLRLLTQLSDLQGLIVKMQEDAAKERSVLYERFLEFLDRRRAYPSSAPSTSVPLRPEAAFRLPGSRLDLRPPEGSLQEKLTELSAISQPHTDAVEVAKT